MTKAFPSFAVVAAAGLLAPPAAMATNYPSCTSLSYTLTVAQGPCLVQDPLAPVCAGEGDYTAIK